MPSGRESAVAHRATLRESATAVHSSAFKTGTRDPASSQGAGPAGEGGGRARAGRPGGRGRGGGAGAVARLAIADRGVINGRSGAPRGSWASRHPEVAARSAALEGRLAASP